MIFQPKITNTNKNTNLNTNTNINTEITNTNFRFMIFPFKITNTNTNINTNIEIINTNTKLKWLRRFEPKKKKKKKRKKKKKMENEVERGHERVAEWGCEGGNWVRPWEGGWLAGYRCEMGEGYGHMGCVRWVREMRGLCEIGEGEMEMRESESCTWLIVAVWMRELRVEKVEVAMWVRELRDGESLEDICT